MSGETYEGWPNYETWAVNLWLTNDEDTYRSLTDLIDEWTHDNEPPSVLADRLEEWVEAMPAISVVLEDASLASDLLSKAISRVEWTDLAEIYAETLLKAG